MSNLTLQTTPLKQPTKQPVLNHIAQQQAINAIKFYFPTASAQAVSDVAVAAAFRNNEVRVGGYDPDDPETFDGRHSWGKLLNNPVYGSLTLGNTDPNNANGNQYTGIDDKQYNFPNMVLPIALTEMNQPTVIGETLITGRPGRVKQYVTLDDWQITISAVVLYGADEAPVDFMEALYKIKQAAVSIPVTNYFLNAFGVTHIVIKDISPVQEEGGYAKLAFAIKACSDIPIEEFLP